MTYEEKYKKGVVEEAKKHNFVYILYSLEV